MILEHTMVAARRGALAILRGCGAVRPAGDKPAAPEFVKLRVSLLATRVHCAVRRGGEARTRSRRR
jgi:hypothetical protein